MIFSVVSRFSLSVVSVSVLYSVFSSSEALRVFQCFLVFDYEYDEMLTSSSFVSACVTGTTETERERERERERETIFNCSI